MAGQVQELEVVLLLLVVVAHLHLQQVTGRMNDARLPLMISPYIRFLAWVAFYMRALVGSQGICFCSQPSAVIDFAYIISQAIRYVFSHTIDNSVISLQV